ncbi:zn 2cys6 transcription factor [Ophiostoma piceae UAMH 11346]|uniref:Zn 2cys6 transcription factor n=1 Tax=Ophiostoma piceae (strain UAMH 11346) TaxID=1262450 RepID=S3BXD9_OPHP1|nr:zn 2cys6 transcription factor [Ophiostoma piceae UAMH 11346]
MTSVKRLTATGTIRGRPQRRATEIVVHFKPSARAYHSSTRAGRTKRARSQSPSTKDTLARWSKYDVTVRDWMFLNATVIDFELFPGVRETPKPNILYTPSTEEQLPQLNLAVDDTGNLRPLTPISASLPWNLLSLNSTESRLLEYFINFITPRCALASNPYQDILLRLAVTEARGPLMDCIMAVAANQMQIVGHGESAASALHRRDRALSALRRQVGIFESAVSDVPLGSRSIESSPLPKAGSVLKASDQLIWSAVMMCFFEISLDCPQSWKVHAEFASKLLLDEAARQPHGYVSDSHQFAAAYLSLHYTLSCSALVSQPKKYLQSSEQNGEHRESFSSGFMALQYLPSDNLFRTLTGCSKDLVTLISEVTELAQHPDIDQLRLASGQAPSTPIPVSPSTAMASLALTPTAHTGDETNCTIYLQQRRDHIERGLHMLVEKPAAGMNAHDWTDSSPSSSEGQMRHICEAKRLAALMYLYSRIDCSDPYKPHMVRLTQRIIELISGISTRTNTVLWPLFIVATLGVRPDCEDDRLVVLTKLTELQQTRQLGNVRKARQVIEDVWKARDLRASDAMRSWDILHGRLDTISLA